MNNNSLTFVSYTIHQLLLGNAQGYIFNYNVTRF